MENNLILAIIGMPGAGKSEAISYIEAKGIPFVRFGQITDEGLAKAGLPVTAENEQNFREKLRRELGMAAYAIQSKSKIDALLEKNKAIAIDGLYSWEEYVYLKKIYPNLILITIFAESGKRYARLTTREVRPLSVEEARKRDIAELEKLNKGGPIAIADYFIENSDDDKEALHKKIDTLLMRLNLK
jgi:dephospho-CoA kinase